MSKPFSHLAILCTSTFVLIALNGFCVILADDEQKLEFFESKIRPVLVKHCYECHSSQSEDVGGNLLLDSKAATLQGGDLGSAIVPGKPTESLLFKAIQYDELEMPPDGKLGPQVIADFRKWIAEGAIDPRTNGQANVRSTIDIEEGRKFWSFQSLTNRDWSHQSIDGGNTESPIDQLVREKQANLEIQFSPPAKPLDLLERVCFDLTGLPPSPALQSEFELGEIEFEQVVDRLLKSSHFGERFGRHWLDVARYADSSGGGRVLLFRDAWRYRDYVFRSFNADKPFDQMIREQIAGDLLPHQNRDQRIDQLTAVGFLMLGAHNYELQDKELLRMEVVDEQINVVGKAFLGMTLSCARCHDHKFDPIPTKDYYALAGIFRSTKSLLPGNVSQFVTAKLPMTPEEQAELDAYLADRKKIENEIKALEKAIKKLTTLNHNFDPQNLDSFKGLILDESQAVIKGKWTASQSVEPYIGKGYLHSPQKDASLTYRFEISVKGRYQIRAGYTASSNRSNNANYQIRSKNLRKDIKVNQRKQPLIAQHFINLTEIQVEAGEQVEVVLTPGSGGTTIGDAIQLVPITMKNSPAKHKKQTTAEKQLANQRKLLADLRKRLKQLGSPPHTQELVMAVEEQPEPQDYFVLVRGDVHSPGDEVKRNALQVIGNLDSFQSLKGSGRKELADWIASPANPLTARVYANRVWYWVMGKPLVGSPDNFGTTGESPTHPELLDYLAQKLIDSKWSTKQLVREIVLSKTYQQSVGNGPTTTDPSNLGWGRHPRKRLDAESIRDRILFFASKQNESVGGPSIKPGTKREFGYQYDSSRRSVYLPVFRNTLNELFEVFDFPNPNLVSGKRTASVLPTQALYLMNSNFVAEKSLSAARRIIGLDLRTFDEQLQLTYRLALSRPPTESETRLARDYFGLSSKDNKSVSDEGKWQGFCQLLISSLEFRYLN